MLCWFSGISAIVIVIGVACIDLSMKNKIDNWNKYLEEKHGK